MHEPCPLPASFPLAPFDALSKLLGGVPKTIPGRKGCGSALTGVAFRYRGAVEAHERFKTVFTAAFGGEERYKEEDASFVMLMQGVSTIECTAYFIFHLGSIVRDGASPSNAAKFPIATDDDLAAISLGSTRKHIKAAFNGKTIATKIQECFDDPARKRLFDFRAVAAHRLALPRDYIMGPIVDGVARIEPSNVRSVKIDAAPKRVGMPLGQTELDASFTEPHMACVTRWTTELLTAAAELAEQELPKLIPKAT